MEYDSCNHSGVGIFSLIETSRKTLRFYVLLWRKNIIDAFLATTFCHLATGKKFQSPI